MSHSALRRAHSKQNRDKGFTLIELMITVVVIGILASISYPSYTQYMRNTQRTDAQSALTDLANRLEKFYFQCNGYNETATTTYVPITGGSIAGCNGLGYANTSSPSGYYTLSIDAATVACTVTTCYSLTATPVATGPQKNDGGLQLTSSNIRRWDKNNNGTYEVSESMWKAH
jgi:type IV pilus assembly protein PilE